MIPSEEIAAFVADHEAAFAGQPEPVVDGVVSLTTGQLKTRALAGIGGAVACRRELVRRTTAQLQQEMGRRV